MVWVWVIVGLAVLLLIWFFATYNGLIVKRNRIDNSWAQIDVQLKRRAELIPNLIETVKGYVKHERETLQAVTNARTAIMSAKSPREAARADNMLTGALKSLFAVAESYPRLKANENFKMLQEELSGTENKIAYARQFYNDTVLEFNNSVEIFPGSLVAGVLGYKEREYFEVPQSQKEVVKVKF